MSDFFGNLFSGIFGSGAASTPIWNPANAIGTETLGPSTMNLTGATIGSDTDWAGKLKGIGDALKGGGGAGGGLTQLPQGQPQSLPSGAPVHQGGDLNQLMQLLQQRRNLLLSLGKPSQGGGGGLLGM